MERQIKIDIRISTGEGGYTFAGVTRTIKNKSKGYCHILGEMDGPTVVNELDIAVEHTKRQLKAVCDLPLPSMLDSGMFHDE